MGQNESFAQIYKITENLWAIDEIGKTILYVFKGNRRVLLLDTGFGLLDLKKLVANLCPGLETIVVNTHAHGDHNSGNGQFEKVYCGRMDEPFSHQKMDEETCKRFADSFFLNNPRAAQVNADDWHPVPAKRVVPLSDGDTIDLGGITLEVLETPGHSIGSICLLDRANGLLFTGDMVLSWEVWGQLEYSSALQYYAQSLQRMAALNVLRVFPAHGTADNTLGFPLYELPPRVLDIYARETEKIVTGKAVGEPYSCFAGDGLCCQFEIGGMVYNPERIGNDLP